MFCLTLKDMEHIDVFTYPRKGRRPGTRLSVINFYTIRCSWHQTIELECSIIVRL